MNTVDFIVASARAKVARLQAYIDSEEGVKILEFPRAQVKDWERAKNGMLVNH